MYKVSDLDLDPGTSKIHSIFLCSKISKIKKVHYMCMTHSWRKTNFAFENFMLQQLSIQKYNANAEKEQLVIHQYEKENRSINN